MFGIALRPVSLRALVARPQVEEEEAPGGAGEAPGENGGDDNGDEEG